MDDLLKYFPELTAIQNEQFKQLGGLYKEWNTKINVISRKDIESIYTNHILHSLAIAKFINFKDGSSIMDVGTGGGFPGIPLAIMFPNVNFLLVDSIKKKLTVVESIIDSLKLDNVTVKQARAETIEEEFDFIVSRAVAAMPKFVAWVRSAIKKKSDHSIKNGIIYLKGGDLSEELKPYRNVRIIKIEDYFDDDFFQTKRIVYLPLKKK